MKSCGTASAIGSCVLLALSVFGAFGGCHETAKPEIPPATSAKPRGDEPVLTTTILSPTSTASASSGAVDSADSEAPPVVKFVEAPAKLEEGHCQTLLFAVAKGQLNVFGESVGPGDVLIVKNPDAGEAKGSGLAVEARLHRPCVVKERPAPEKAVVRASSASKLEWAGGKMNAHLDVGAKLSPLLYLGRLEGSAGVAEHVHEASWEILAAVDAAGTFTLDGKEQRLGPKQVVVVPKGTKHAWKPDPGSKLVAIQMYMPPGPEQRFLALAAADKLDAGGADSGRSAAVRP